jgi:uncharacterized membrane protein
MTRSDYITALDKALKDEGVRDRGDILAEYDEHFTYKLTDGYSEEEIAAKLGAPDELARQFLPNVPTKRGSAFALAALIPADIIFAMIGIIIYAFTIVLAAAAVSFLCTGIVLLFGLGALPFVSVPAMPYGAALLFALACAALAALTVCATVCYTATANALLRSYLRFHRNTLSWSKDGEHVRPPLPVRLRLKPKTRTALRTAAIAGTLFAVFFLAVGYVTAAFSAGAIEFWHVWHWFE